jgi:DNA-binding transcriptional MerR regulator
MPTYTVGVLARSVGLARSTLLYYDRIGLLPAAQRSVARYRLYGEDARTRLEAICTYREVGLSLAEIRGLLDARGGQTAVILTARLDRLNDEIACLRKQQRVIVQLLKNRTLLRGTRALDKRRWVQILAGAGLDEPAMHRWHVEFEAVAPEAHQDFLESLGIAPAEISSIRRWSRAGDDEDGSGFGAHRTTFHVSSR